jgi:hypothetical protein
MHPRHVIQIDTFENSDWIMSDDSISDPLEILIRQELEHDAEMAGFDSVDDYLHANPDLTFN